VIAVDTSVVVRVVTVDDAAQFKRASKFLAANNCLLLLTVALETEWVLRSLYHLPPGRIAESIEKLAAVPTVLVEKAEVLKRALAALREGFDFGDAIHLYSADAEGVDSLATFDKKFASRAPHLKASVPVIEI
jgi:predicted nucleic-acid-binding protein